MKFDNAVFEAAYGTKHQLPKSDYPEVAFSGRSNVGKSSLLNKLLNRKALARVSSVPGKTATVNFYRIGDVRFADLPGYGFAKVAKSERDRWAELMEHYFGSKRDIRLVVQLVDMRHPPSKDDIMMLEYLRNMEIPFIIALTKSDKLNKSERNKRLELLKSELDFLGSDIIAIPFSAQNGEGRDEIREQISKFIEK